MYLRGFWYKQHVQNLNVLKRKFAINIYPFNNYVVSVVTEKQH